MKKLLSIGEAAKALGVTTTTMRNWDKNGMLHPDEHTRGGDRRYSIDTLRNFDKNAAIKIDGLRRLPTPVSRRTTRRRTWFGRWPYWRHTAPARVSPTR